MKDTLAIPVSYRCERRDPGFVKTRKRLETNSARISYNFARRAVSHARAFAPVDTGFLKSQIEWERLGKGHYEVRVNGSVSAETGAYYAIYVEYGHTIVNSQGERVGYQQAQPFFRPAIELALAEFRAEMRSVFA